MLCRSGARCSWFGARVGRCRIGFDTSGIGRGWWFDPQWSVGGRAFFPLCRTRRARSLLRRVLALRIAFGRLLLRPAGLRPRMPRRDSQAQNVGTSPGIASSHRGGELHDLGREYLLGGDDSLEFHQFAAVLTVREPLEQIPVDQTTREPDAHPHAGLRDRIQLGRHQVIEVAVQVGRRQQREHPSYRVLHGCGSRRRDPRYGGGARRGFFHSVWSGLPADGGAQLVRTHRMEPPRAGLRILIGDVPTVRRRRATCPHDPCAPRAGRRRCGRSGRTRRSVRRSGAAGRGRG